MRLDKLHSRLHSYDLINSSRGCKRAEGSSTSLLNLGQKTRTPDLHRLENTAHSNPRQDSIAALSAHIYEYTRRLNSIINEQNLGFFRPYTHIQNHWGLESSFLTTPLMSKGCYVDGEQHPTINVILSVFFVCSCRDPRVKVLINRMLVMMRKMIRK